ncbi:MAG: GTP-sensing pleiotropic transcriptional regulator CodY [Lachnospiraceae bacterium]|nr:GTP-sensing pleiotropic transcriptional regulator CodY [Lachnospiraceae bacterium]MBR1876686.1 GTP-sensing pleiotropic transcriptional regulator CodY [Lachnospiraceae bacterium]
MSSIELLDKTRKINKLLHNNKKSKVVFDDMCLCMGDILNSNVLCLSRKGKVLGIRKDLLESGEGLFCGYSRGDFIDDILNERLLGILSTKENVKLETLGFEEELTGNIRAVITPVDIAGERLGTLFFIRPEEEYSIDDIILCEYGATVVSLEMLRSLKEEDANESRMNHAIEGALSALSYSETEALIRVFDELNGLEGIVVASRIADKSNITRSVIVNALRKFESAGIIESRSSGMKGTYIRVLNPQVFDEIEGLKNNQR